MEAILRCTCGNFKGKLSAVIPSKVNRVVCYCDDCQAFAHYLDRASEVLDASGGSDITQMSPAHIEVTEGGEHLACMRMSEAGIYRWYASCCNTPVGNTGHYGLPFIGMIHELIVESADKEALFGPIKGHVQTKFARSELPASKLPLGSILRFVKIMLGAKFSRAHKHAPFF